MSTVELLDGFVRAQDLVGVAEVAQGLSVSRTQVNTWMTRSARNGFPAPIKRLACGPVWDWLDVVAWYTTYKPNRGGAPRGERNGRSRARG